jgi:hypothetical protein
MIKELVKLSNHLDAKGLRREADYLDGVIRKLSDLTEQQKGEVRAAAVAALEQLSSAINADKEERATRTRHGFYDDGKVPVLIYGFRDNRGHDEKKALVRKMVTRHMPDGWRLDERWKDEGLEWTRWIDLVDSAPPAEKDLPGKNNPFLKPGHNMWIWIARIVPIARAAQENPAADQENW